MGMGAMHDVSGGPPSWLQAAAGGPMGGERRDFQWVAFLEAGWIAGSALHLRPR